MFAHRTRSWFRLLIAPAAVAVFLPWSSSTSAASEPGRPAAAERTPADAALAVSVQSFDKVKEEKFSWGWIRWLMNSKLDPQANVTLGIVEINAGQSNPPHVHGNCEEVLYVLSGSCEHRVGKQWVTLKAGDTLRIPAGVPHAARTLAKESVRAVVVYNAGERQFTVVKSGE